MSEKNSENRIAVADFAIREGLAKIGSAVDSLNRSCYFQEIGSEELKRSLNKIYESLDKARRTVDIMFENPEQIQNKYMR